MISEKQEILGKTPKKLHLASVFQLLFSLLAIGILSLFSGILFISGWLALLGQNASLLEVGASFMSAFALLFTAALLMPSAFTAIRRLFNPMIETKWLSKLRKFVGNRTILLLIIFSLAGAFVSQFEILALFALPPIHAFVSSLIVLMLLIWATRNISMGSPQRYWGVLAVSIIFGPLIALILEIFAGAVILGLALFYLFTQEQYIGLLDSLSRIDLSGVGQDLLLQQFSALSSDPVIIFFLLMFISVAVPLIEELIKPIGLYFSINKKWSPASGFALGALSGAGFALFENLALSVGPENWSAVMGARIGTTAMHILTSGLIGRALVIARNERKYWKLFGTYLLAVFLHGSWNGLAIFLSLSALQNESNLLSSPILVNGMLLGLLILTVGSITLLRFINRRATVAL